MTYYPCGMCGDTGYVPCAKHLGGGEWESRTALCPRCDGASTTDRARLLVRALTERWMRRRRIGNRDVWDEYDWARDAFVDA